MDTSRTYFSPTGEHLNSVPQGQPVPALAEFVHRQFRSLISETDFPCIGARAAFRGNSYRFGIYDTMASLATSRRLASDLAGFASERRRLQGDFNTFVAAFNNPFSVDEVHFELLVWSQLQKLHDLDASAWDPRVSSDPDDPEFGFSFAGEAFFIVGLHAASSRWARRFSWPVLVFNGHDQFQRLRERGLMDRFQKTIRHRELNLQGSINPNIANFGEVSDARQYSGRQVEPDWKCPFHAVYSSTSQEGQRQGWVQQN